MCSNNCRIILQINGIIGRHYYLLSETQKNAIMLVIKLGKFFRNPSTCVLILWWQNSALNILKKIFQDVN